MSRDSAGRRPRRRRPTRPWARLRSANGARFGEEVVDAVTNQVVGGDVPPETPLPSESEMAEGFGVSRTVIREAMKELETMGLVEKRAGKRTWTAPASSWNLLDRRILKRSGPS